MPRNVRRIETSVENIRSTLIAADESPKRLGGYHGGAQSSKNFGKKLAAHYLKLQAD